MFLTFLIHFQTISSWAVLLILRTQVPIQLVEMSRALLVLWELKRLRLARPRALPVKVG
jgi:hypothetical protein